MVLLGSYDMLPTRISRSLISAGFTLIEMMVIAPFIILMIGLFIVYIVNTTGESARQSEQNAAAYDIQNALNSIEDDSEKAMAFITTVASANTSYPIATPQGSDNGTAGYSTTSGHLLIKAAATTSSPLSSSRTLVYMASPDSTCSSSTITQNDPYPILLAYFVSSNTLWRRTILGNSSSPGLCAGYTPWQKASCSASVIATYPSVCKSADVELVNNVSSFSVSYYDTADGSTALTTPYTWTDDTTPAAIQVTLSTSKSVGGSTATASGTLRVSSINIR